MSNIVSMRYVAIRAVNAIQNRIGRTKFLLTLLLRRRVLESWIRTVLKISPAAVLVMTRGSQGLSGICFHVRAKGVSKEFFLKVVFALSDPRLGLKLAKREASTLKELEKQPGLPIPLLRGFDEGGLVGWPLLLVDKVEGSSQYEPVFLNNNTKSVAKVLAEIHKTPGRSDWDTLHEWPFLPVRTFIPDWAQREKGWKFIEHVLRGTEPLPSSGLVVSHGDFGPHNLLWNGQNLTAVVDWANLVFRSPEWDVAHFRLALAAICGEQAAEDFLSYYRHYSGNSCRYQAHYDAKMLFKIDKGNGEPIGYTYWSGAISKKSIHFNLNKYAESIAARLGEV